MLPCLIINGTFRAIFYWVSKYWIVLVLPYFVLWLVQKTRATFSTNQIQNWNQSRIGRGFPALHAVWLFYFEFIIGSQRYYSFLLIGRWLLWFWFLRRLIDKRPVGIDPWLGILLHWLLVLYVSLLQCHALINDGSLALCTASEQCNLVYLKNTLFEGLYICIFSILLNWTLTLWTQRVTSV